MRTIAAALGSVVLSLGVISTALAQPAPPPPQGVVVRPYEVAPNPDTRWVHSYSTGQWVYTTDYGWVWVPRGASTTLVDGVPYARLYTRTNGWNWYVSPWGFGGYRYGEWVTRPWRPNGWRQSDWVARPNVVTRIRSPRR